MAWRKEPRGELRMEISWTEFPHKRPVLWVPKKPVGHISTHRAGSATIHIVLPDRVRENVVSDATGTGLRQQNGQW